MTVLLHMAQTEQRFATPCTCFPFTVTGACVYNPRRLFHEEEGGRIFESHRQSRLDATVGAELSRWLSFFREGADADGAWGGRSLHQHHPARLSSAGRSV